MIDFLESVLSDNRLFQNILNAADPKQYIQENFDINVNDLFSCLSDINPLKKWEIFSRVRFEYVRPTCTKRTELGTVLPLMSQEDKIYGLKAYFLAGLTVSDEVKCAVNLLESYPENSLGMALHTYYQSNNIPSPKEASLFPPDYILCHDFHHVLLNSTVSEEGELEVICFESGMLQKTEFPILLVEQLEILLNSKSIDICKTHKLLKAWNEGAKSVPSVAASNIIPHLSKPLDTVRCLFNVTPLC